jgi:hypothetical protein
MNMKRMVRIQLMTVAAIAMLVSAFVATEQLHAQQDSGLTSPKVLGVYFHADWDSKSEQIRENLFGLKDKYDGEPLLGIMVDLTNMSTRHREEMMVSVLGLESLWNENGGKTGVLYLVDPSTKQVLATMDSSTTFDDACAAIDAALAG